MEYIYAAMLLHSAKREITESGIRDIIKAAGIQPDDAKIKALVASLKEVNIDEAISKAAVVQAAPVAVSVQQEQKVEKPKEEDSKKAEEDAAAGLSSLFG